jgi:phage terminase large subunit
VNALLRLALDKRAEILRSLAEGSLSVSEREEARERERREAEGRSLVERWRRSVALYARHRFGLTLLPRQVEFIEALLAHDWVAVKAAQKVGKSLAAAVAACWFAECHSYGRVVLMSATATNLRAVLWEEVRALYRRSTSRVSPVEHPMPDDSGPATDPATGWRLAGCYVVGTSADSEEALGGYSRIEGKGSLFVCDEASSEFFDLVWRAVEGNCQGGGKILLLGNPTRTTGKFFAVFRNAREKRLWVRFTIAAEDVCDSGVPGLVTRDAVERVREARGEKDIFFVVRVLGEFFEGATNAIVSLASWERATARFASLTDAQERLFLASSPLEIGVDVAWFGDDTSVIQPRRGRRAYKFEDHYGRDTAELADLVVRTIDRLGLPGEEVRVKVDTVGIGAGVYANLRVEARARRKVRDAVREAGQRYDKPLIVPVRVEVGRTADVPKYVNVRSQIAFGLAEWLEDGAVVPPDDSLEEEVLAPTYSPDARMRLQAEPKKDVKKRLGRSPDHFDALALAVYRGRDDLADVEGPGVTEYHSPLRDW